ncbi:hypothetical protein OHB14_45125 [Streptomyces sp. NBC_01613]|uniref:hypothetical protein n=1 Tax=Streptomyces sp. NBC_01613 TaxID=2975896 RepID=UPI00386B7030
MKRGPVGVVELVERWTVLRENHDPVDARHRARRPGFALMRKALLTWHTWASAESSVHRYDT